MKKIFLFIFILFFLFSFVSALDIQINEEYKLGEPILMKVSGLFLEDITKSDISFYRRHMQTSFANYGVVKIEGEFYIYVSGEVSKIPDNYSIQIKEVRYMDGVQISTKTIIGNFSLNNQIADFSLYPGAGVTEGNFSTSVQNLQGTKIYLHIGGGTYQLYSGETKNLVFLNHEINETRMIEISTENQEYILPIQFIYLEPPVQDPVCGNGILESGEGCDEGYLNGALCSPEYGGSCEYCSTSCTLETITGAYCGDLIIQEGYEGCDDGNLIDGDGCSSECLLETPNPICGNGIPESGEGCDDGNLIDGDGCSSECLLEIEDPEENETVIPEDNETIIIDENETIILDENKTESEEENKTIIDENQTEEESVDPGPIFQEEGSEELRTCSELGGVICSSKECDGEAIYAFDNVCCLGKCIEEPKSNNKKVIGWILVIVLVLFLAWFFGKKYRGTRNTRGLLGRR